MLASRNAVETARKEATAARDKEAHASTSAIVADIDGATQERDRLAAASQHSVESGKRNGGCKSNGDPRLLCIGQDRL